jgi:hypothetical protein
MSNSHQQAARTSAKAPTQRPGAKRPYHVGVAVGLTTSLYAATLLLATRLQIDADRALIADREPMQRAIDALGSHHDTLTSLLDEARDAYNTAATGFGSVIDGMAHLDEHLTAVSGTIEAAERLSASISANLSLPVIPVPRTASGGSGSGGGTGGTGTTKPPTVKPPAAPPPPTSGGTGASGAP